MKTKETEQISEGYFEVSWTKEELTKILWAEYIRKTGKPWPKGEKPFLATHYGPDSGHHWDYNKGATLSLKVCFKVLGAKP